MSENNVPKHAIEANSNFPQISNSNEETNLYL